MLKIGYYNFLTTLLLGLALVVSFIVLLAPTVTHAQTSAFAGAEIVILNQNTPFHYEPNSDAVRFVVTGGTLAEVLYFADPEVRDGQIWRKLRVADGYYGYVRESLISKYTGTIPTIWREVDYQPSQVHLNYEARKVNYNIVINQGVNYVTPPEGVTGGSSNTEDEEAEEETQEDEPEEEADEDEPEEDVREEVIATNEINRELLLLIIKLLKELLNMKLQSM